MPKASTSCARRAGSEVPEEQRYALDLADIAEVWRRGSVVGSWLLDLTAIALAEDPELERYSGFVEDSGEGRWTVMAAIEEAVPADVLSAALYARFRSREEDTLRRQAAVGDAQRVRRPCRAQERMAEMDEPRQSPPAPCILVIFGAAGDLTKRLLVPALYNLGAPKLLPEQFALIGVARSDKDDETFRASSAPPCASSSPAKSAADDWQWLAERMHYIRGEFDDPAVYKTLTRAAGRDRQDASHRRQLPLLSRDPGDGIRRPSCSGSARPASSARQTDSGGA